MFPVWYCTIHLSEHLDHLRPSACRLRTCYRNVSASSQLCPRHRWWFLFSLCSCSRNRTCVSCGQTVTDWSRSRWEIQQWAYLSVSLPFWSDWGWNMTARPTAVRMTCYWAASCLRRSRPASIDTTGHGAVGESCTSTWSELCFSHWAECGSWYNRHDWPSLLLRATKW